MIWQNLIQRFHQQQFTKKLPLYSQFYMDQWVKDGSIQGFLEILRLAYVGPNILSASSTMDKLLAKHVFEAVGVPQVPYVAAFADENQGEIAQEVVEKLEFPVFVKPANMGSSVGISKVDDLADLQPALSEAYNNDNPCCH